MNADVTGIVVEQGRAKGIVLADGERIEADVVVSNADSAWTYRHLVPAASRRRWTDRKIEKSRYSMGLFVWYFGTKRRYPDVAHHSILLGPRYRGLLDDIFGARLADDFSLYLHRPTATDPGLAPDGMDAFYVLSPVPNLGADVDWNERAEPYRKAIESHLADTVLPNLGSEIVTSRVMTPLEFRDELLAFRGAAFSFEPILSQSAWFRPHNRSEEVEGLYLVGAGTHPGAGVPGVLSSARVLDAVVPDPESPLAMTRTASRRPGATLADDRRVGRRLLREGSKSFYAASRLLPRRVREDAGAVYAWCRVADHAVDRTEDPAGALVEVRAGLERVYGGRPEGAVERAFAEVVFRNRISRDIPEAMIEGFEWDAAGRLYADAGRGDRVLRAGRVHGGGDDGGRDGPTRSGHGARRPAASESPCS